MPNYRRHQEPGGTYFFTVVAAGREPIFTQEAARIALHAAIQAVRKEHPFNINAWGIAAGSFALYLELA